MKLQTRFLFNLGFLACLAIAGFSIYIRQGINNLNEQDVGTRLSTHISLSREFSLEVVANIKSDLDLISNDSLTRRYFSADEVARYQLFHSELTRTINRYLKHSELYSEIAIILPDGFKEIYVNDGSIDESDVDKSLASLEKKSILQEKEVTFLIEEMNETNHLLVAYVPIRKVSSLLTTQDNPKIGYIKISTKLEKLSKKISSSNILASFIYENTEIYDADTATKTGLSANISKPNLISTRTLALLPSLTLRVTALNNGFENLSHDLFINSVLVILIAILSLLMMTYLLLKYVILRPLANFTALIENSNFENRHHHEVTAYDNNEFGRLLGRFDELMNRLQDSTDNVKRQAFTDTLTGLPNRAAMYNLLEKHTKDDSEPFSVLFIDLDGFKQINDNYGHETGDLVLIEVSKKLSNIVRGNGVSEVDNLDIRQDAVIRLGGDEFTIVLLGKNNSELVANRIILEFQSSINIEGKALYTGTSIGISEFPTHARAPSLLIQYADLAMYQAKYSGKMRYCKFTQELALREKKRLQIEATVREGIEFNRFEAFFQAKIDANTSQICGLEALARLRDQDDNLISPGLFIPAAQESGVLEYITYVVTEHSCQLLKSLQNPELVASINISPRQLNDMRLIADIRIIMWRYQISPCQIEFEITEEELITNFETVSKNLNLLRRFGFRTALDDFGSGYSSLGQLKKFTFDTLKLDRDFVSTEDYNTDAAIGVLSSIKTLADTLNMEVVAEGIETKAQLEFIKSFGIHIIQGFYCSKPIPQDEFVKFYRTKALLCKQNATQLPLY